MQKGFLYPLAIPNTASFVTSPQVRPLTDQPHDLLPKDLKAPPQRAKMGAVGSFTEGNVMKKILAIFLMLLITVGCGDQPIEMTFKKIPAGTFMMGSPEKEGHLYDEEQHNVTITAFHCPCVTSVVCM